MVPEKGNAKKYSEKDATLNISLDTEFDLGNVATEKEELEDIKCLLHPKSKFLDV
jgi:hypothetical protein